MRTVTIRLRAQDLSTQMAAMRAWLDQNRCEPSRFLIDQSDDTTVILVDFEKNPDAEAFRRQFAPAKPPLHTAREQRAEADSWGPNSAADETMLQVCRWRIMAEEIRAKSDCLLTNSAKETMRIVAATWDQMAENLERRLTDNGKSRR